MGQHSTCAGINYFHIINLHAIVVKTTTSYHTARAVLKSNRHTVEIGEIDNTLTQIHDRSHLWLGTHSSITSGGVIWDQTSPFCKCKFIIANLWLSQMVLCFDLCLFLLS